MKVNPWKILIVDDDPLVVKTLERLLFKRNYLFLSIGSGEEALERIAEIKPDMVLLDVFMKGITGFDVCSHLNKIGFVKKVPVIFLTGNADAREIIKGFQSGAVDYILKPFNAEELMARIHTHLELKRMREEIHLMNLIKTRFFSIMTHDIKDSLTGVKGVSGFLHDELKIEAPNLDEVRKLSTILLQDSLNLYQFVDNLIKWDKIESDPATQTITEFSISDEVDRIVAGFDKWSSEKHITVNNKIPGDIYLKTNRLAFHDILKELISNAIKYTISGDNVSIKGTRNTSGVVITISDNGVGMEKDVIEHVFRLDTPHPKTIGTANERGIGLGLIICNSWVKKLDGNIKIVSERHKGTIVTLQLPDLKFQEQTTSD